MELGDVDQPRSVDKALKKTREAGQVSSTGSSYMDNYVVNSVAALQSINQGIKFSDALVSAQAEFDAIGAQASAGNAVDRFVAEENSEIVDIVSSTPDLRDRDGVDAAASLVSANEELRSSETGLQEAMVISYSGKEVSDRFVKEESFKDYSRALLGKFLEDEGVLDKVIDFGGLMIPGNYLYSLNEIKGIEGLGVTDIDEITFAIRSLPVEKRAAILPGIIESVQEATGNSLITAEVIANMTGLDDTLDLSLGIERATLGLMGAASVVKTVKGLNSIKRLKNVAGEVAAGEHTADIIEEGATAVKQENLVTADVQATANPFRYEELFAGATDEVADEVAQSLARRKAVVDEEVARVTISQDGVMRADEMASIRNTLEQEIKQRPNVKDVDISFDGNKVTGNITRPDGAVEPFEYTLSANDIGSFDGAMTFGRTKGYLTSPATLFSKIKEDVVEQSTLLKDFLTKKNFKNLEDAAKGVYSGITKEGIAKVDDVLLAGDSFRDGAIRGRIYNLRELTVEGVPTSGGTVRLSPEEASSYYAARDMFDKLWGIKNHATRRQLQFEGYSNLQLGKNGLDPSIKELGENAVVKQVSQPDEAIAQVFDNTTGQIRVYADLQDDITAGRLNLYKSRNTVRLEDSTGVKNYDYIVAKADDVGDLPDAVLHYQPGYVTRIRPTSNVVVRSFRAGEVNGVAKAEGAVRTERMFDRFDEAEQFVAEMAAKGEPGVTYRQSIVNNLDPRAYENMENVSYGGLYSSARSSREIGFGLDNVTPERLSAVDSMERMMGHVAKVASFNEFKLQAIQKFTNTFGSNLENPNVWTSQIKQGVNPKTADQINRLRNWLRAQVGMPDPEQKAWASTMQSFAAGMEKGVLGYKPLDKSKTLQSIHNNLIAYSSDPFALGRSLAFNALLGNWNPAQLLVQATGASIAFSLNPERFAGNFGRTLGLRYGSQLLEAGNPAGLKAMAKKLYKPAGFRSADEYEETVTAMHNTGLMQSLRSNADYEAYKAGMSISQSTFKKIWDSRLMFFREGEGFTRLYGWSNAYADWAKANPGARMTQGAANQITKDSLQYTLNLNSSNKAIWQDGAISIPTQFLQISTKYLEMLAPSLGSGASNLSKTKRGQLMLTQMALFGAAGVPLLGDDLAKAVSEVWEDSPTLMTEEEQSAFNGGAMGWLSNEVVGFGGLDSNRFSISSGLTDLLTGIMADDADMAEVIIGAFGQVPVRLAKALEYSAHTLPAAVYNFDAPTMLNVADKYLDITSTWSNASKAYGWYSMGQARDSKGGLLFRVNPETDWPAIVAKGLGLSTLRESKMWQTGQYLYERKQYLKDVSDQYTVQILEYYGRRHEEEAKKSFQGMTTLLFAGLTPSEKQSIVASAYKKAFPVNSKEEKQAREVLKQISQGVENIPVGSITVDEEQ